jgi:hypothetical protein
VHARAGHTDKAHQVLSELSARAASGYISPFHFAIVHTGLGQGDQAMEWLEEAFRQRLWLLCVVKTDPIFDPLRSDQRFQALLRRMKLSDAG